MNTDQPKRLQFACVFVQKGLLYVVHSRQLPVYPLHSFLSLCASKMAAASFCFIQHMIVLIDVWFVLIR